MKIVNDDVYGVIQIGAGKGEEFFSYAHLVSNIICFEPVKEEFEILKRNVRYSLYSKYTILSDYVVCNKTGKVPFYIGNRNENSSLLDIDLENNPNNPHNPYLINKTIVITLVIKTNLIALITLIIITNLIALITLQPQYP
jgi:FkbM family methyltransferase